MAQSKTAKSVGLILSALLISSIFSALIVFTPDVKATQLNTNSLGLRWVADFSAPWSLSSWAAFDENGYLLPTDTVAEIKGEVNSGKYVSFKQSLSAPRFLINKYPADVNFLMEFFVTIQDRYEDGYPGIIFRWLGYNDYYWIEFSANNVKLMRAPSTTLQTSPTYYFYTNQWHHVLINQSSSSTIKVIVNGITLISYDQLPAFSQPNYLGLKSYKGKAQFANIVVADDAYGLAIGRAMTWLDKAYRDISDTEAVIKDHPGIPFKINIGGTVNGDSVSGGTWFFPTIGGGQPAYWEINVVPEYSGYVYDYRFKHNQLQTDVTVRISYIEYDPFSMRVSMLLRNYQSAQTVHFVMGERLIWSGANYANFTWIQPGGYFSSMYCARHATQLAAWIYKEVQHLDRGGANGWAIKAIKLQIFMSKYGFTYDMYAPMFQADTSYPDDWIHLQQTWPDPEVYDTLPRGSFGYPYRSRLADPYFRSAWISGILLPFPLPDGAVLYPSYYDSLTALHLLNKYGTQSPFLKAAEQRLKWVDWNGWGTRLSLPLMSDILDQFNLLWAAYPTYLTASYAAAAAKYASLTNNALYKEHTKQAISIILSTQWIWEMPEQRDTQVYMVRRGDSFGGFLSGYTYSGSNVLAAQLRGRIYDAIELLFGPSLHEDKYLTFTAAESTLTALQALIVFRLLFPNDVAALSPNVPIRIQQRISPYAYNVAQSDESGQLRVLANADESTAGASFAVTPQNNVANPVVIVSGVRKGLLQVSDGGWTLFGVRAKIRQGQNILATVESILDSLSEPGSSEFNGTFIASLTAENLTLIAGQTYTVYVEVFAIGSGSGVANYYTTFFNDYGVMISNVVLGGTIISLDIIPKSIQLMADSFTHAAIRVHSTKPHTVNISLQNLPNGVSYSLNVSSATTPYAADLTLYASPNTPSGEYTVTLIADDGQISEQRTFALTIGSTPTPMNYLAAFNPTDVKVSPSSSTTSNLVLTLLSGSSETASISLLSAPEGLTISSSSTTVSIPSTTPITISAASDMMAGEYQAIVKVVSSNSGVSRLAALTVTVAPEVSSSINLAKPFVEKLYKVFDQGEGKWAASGEYFGLPIRIRTSNDLAWKLVGQGGSVVTSSYTYDTETETISFSAGGYSNSPLITSTTYWNYSPDYVKITLTNSQFLAPNIYAEVYIYDTYVGVFSQSNVGKTFTLMLPKNDLSQLKTLRYTIRSGTQLAQNYYWSESQTQQFSALTTFLEKQGFATDYDIYAPLYGYGKDLKDNFLWDISDSDGDPCVYHDVHVTSLSDSHNYPYVSKASANIQSYLEWTHQDYLVPMLQALHILNKYGNPDKVYTDQWGISQTPRGVARWVESTWKGYGIPQRLQSSVDSSEASATRTAVFLALETKLGYTYNDQISRGFAHQAAQTLVKAQQKDYITQTATATLYRPAYKGGFYYAWNQEYKWSPNTQLADIFYMQPEYSNPIPSTAESTYAAIQALKIYNAAVYGYSQETPPFKKSTWSLGVIPDPYIYSQNAALGYFDNQDLGKVYYVSSLGTGYYYSYHFFGYSDLITVPSSGAITVSGYFAFFGGPPLGDTGYSRGEVRIYILNAAANSMLQQRTILQTDPNYPWNGPQHGIFYYNSTTFTGLTAGSQIRVAIGRPDYWYWDYSLYAYWSQVTITYPIADFDYKVLLSYPYGVVAPGATTTASLSVQKIGIGTSQTVTLSATAPEGVTVSFNPQSGLPTFSSQMQIQVSSSTPEGTYGIVVSASSTGKLRQATYLLVVSRGYEEKTWAAMTWAPGHYVRFQEITSPYLHWSVDTIGSYDYNYHFMGHTSTHLYKVKPDGTITVSGYFLKSDTLPNPYQNSMVLVYLFDANYTAILRQDYALDWNYANNQWFSRSITFTGLTPGTLVHVAIGRPDWWTTDYQLVAKWRNVTIYSDGVYLGSGARIASHFNLILKDKTATVTAGAAVEIPLTVEWFRNETAVLPLKVDVIIPGDKNETLTYTVSGPIIEPSEHFKKAHYVITVSTASDIKARTYPILIRVTEQAGQIDRAVKTATYLIRVSR